MVQHHSLLIKENQCEKPIFWTGHMKIEKVTLFLGCLDVILGVFGLIYGMVVLNTLPPQIGLMTYTKLLSYPHRIYKL